MCSTLLALHIFPLHCRLSVHPLSYAQHVKPVYYARRRNLSGYREWKKRSAQRTSTGFFYNYSTSRLASPWDQHGNQFSDSRRTKVCKMQIERKLCRRDAENQLMSVWRWHPPSPQVQCCVKCLRGVANFCLETVWPHGSRFLQH